MNDITKPTSGAARNRHCWSLTVWLTLCNAVAAFLLISLIAGFLYLGLAQQLEYQNLHYLHDEIHTLQVIIATQGDTGRLERESRVGHTGDEYVKHYIRVLDESGAVVLETPGMEQILHASGTSLSTRGVDITHRTSEGQLILSRTETVKLMPEGEATVQVALGTRGT